MHKTQWRVLLSSPWLFWAPGNCTSKQYKARKQYEVPPLALALSNLFRAISKKEKRQYFDRTTLPKEVISVSVEVLSVDEVHMVRVRLNFSWWYGDAKTP